MPQDQQQLMTMIVSFGVLALVLAWRTRRMRTARPLQLERLWIFPTFFTVVVLLLLAAHPPAGMVGVYVLMAFAAGAGAGWFRGRSMTIRVDPETHSLSQQGSVAAMLIIFALVAVRYAARAYMQSHPDLDPGTIVSVTDVLLVLGLGFVVAQRAEMYQRARAMLAEAREGKS